ncbi:UPF0158 family protein [Chryseobacterium sp. RR2-3-20]|uniref:UPF0158 family protein n=1 Tax=Chryseobacterium sp. RR2-3-20 TaxID=2787626 RepID=UPI001ADFA14C|nr:UPF0158 family protein [Chryseobacterium sp. RR2-3-20]
MNVQLKKLIDEIENNFDCGMQVFINTTNLNICSFPDFDAPFSDEEMWEDQKKELDDNWGNYIEVERWDSTFSFEIMKSFAENISENSLLKDKLLNALQKQKPFRGFKNIIDYEIDYRQRWFEYKKKHQQNYVEKELERLLQ